MATRRGFIAGLLAAGAIPRPSWADAGDPAYLAAAKLPSGAYNLFGLSEDGDELFSLPLPGRGHAAAAHPLRPEAVAFARRPGTFAIVLDCRSGDIEATLETPEGRHFNTQIMTDRDGSSPVSASAWARRSPFQFRVPSSSGPYSATNRGPRPKWAVIWRASTCGLAVAR